MLVLYTRYHFLNPIMIGYKQMENSVLSCFLTTIFIFLKLVIKSSQFHYSYFIASCNTSKSISFDPRKIDKSFPPLSRTNIHIPTKKTVHLFKKHKFCKPKYIHKSFVHCLHVREGSAPVLPFVLLVLPFLFQPILVNQF